MEEICEELRFKLKEAVKRNLAEGILLSGGLDSSILAFILSAILPEVKAFNVRLEDYGDDFKYAQLLCQHLHINLYPVEVKVEEAFKAIPEVIGIQRSFDPALPNDLAIYFALKSAKKDGIKKVITGDGSDELFAGYSYMFSLNLEEYIPRLVEQMSFSTNKIGSFLGIEVKQPFLDKEIIDFALSVKPNIKIREEKGVKFGKWILRKSFEGFLPSEIIWQDKRPIEMGTGFTKLRELIEEKLSKSEFEEKKRSLPLRFLSKDHFFYFQVHREVIGEIPKPKKGEKVCANCGAGIGNSPFHCWVCGWTQSLLQGN